MSSLQDWSALQKESRLLEKEGPCVYVVVRFCGYEKDDYLFAYYDRGDAETKCAEINGDGYEHFLVYPIPLAALAETRDTVDG